MRLSHRFAIVAACLVILMGCSAKEEPAGVLTEGQKRSYQRAGEVEGILQESAEQREKESAAY